MESARLVAFSLRRLDGWLGSDGCAGFYPDEYNGAWIACPDPIDFSLHRRQHLRARECVLRRFKVEAMPRPGKRNYLGELSATVEDMNHMELALANSRSGGQWDIWQAVYSPVGSDGYPKIWDKLTGKIDRSVAEYWRENYDLGHILKRDWAKIGPKLEGKLHIYVGEADNYFLNNAVYLVEDFLKTTKNPNYGGVVDYEPRAEHCWNGDHTRPNAYSRSGIISFTRRRLLRGLRRAHHRARI